jgi:hypothetical protein
MATHRAAVGGGDRRRVDVVPSQRAVLEQRSSSRDVPAASRSHGKRRTIPPFIGVSPTATSGCCYGPTGESSGQRGTSSTSHLLRQVSPCVHDTSPVGLAALASMDRDVECGAVRPMFTISMYTCTDLELAQHHTSDTTPVHRLLSVACTSM